MTKKGYLTILFILIAAVFGFLGYKFTEPNVPTVVEKSVPVTEVKLPEDFPEEFLVDKDAELVAADVMTGRVSTIFMSKLPPAELYDKFLSAINFKGWKVITKDRDDSFAQLLAHAAGNEENSAPKTVNFRAIKLPGAESRIDISYTK